MTPEEQLLAAADDMAAHGKCEGQYLAPPEGWYGTGTGGWWQTGRSCAMGSLARVNGLVDEIGCVGAEVEMLPATRRLAEQIRKTVSGLWDHANLSDAGVIAAYNDRETTTAEDMILTMKEAAHG